MRILFGAFDSSKETSPSSTVRSEKSVDFYSAFLRSTFTPHFCGVLLLRIFAEYFLLRIFAEYFLLRIFAEYFYSANLRSNPA